MRNEYDFKHASRKAPFNLATQGKTRITIRLDNDVLEWFEKQVEDAGGGNYQTSINAALRQFMEQSDESMEDTLRRVLREELHSVK